MRRIRLHLSTLIVMTLGAAVLLAANLTPYTRTAVHVSDNQKELAAFKTIPQNDFRFYPSIVEYRTWTAGWPYAMWHPQRTGDGVSRYEPILPASHQQAQDFTKLLSLRLSSAAEVEQSFPTLKPFLKYAPVLPAPPFRQSDPWIPEDAFRNFVIAIAIVFLLGAACELFFHFRERSRQRCASQNQ